MENEGIRGGVWKGNEGYERGGGCGREGFNAQRRRNKKKKKKKRKMSEKRIKNEK